MTSLFSSLWHLLWPVWPPQWIMYFIFVAQVHCVSTIDRTRKKLWSICAFTIIVFWFNFYILGGQDSSKGMHFYIYVYENGRKHKWKFLCLNLTCLKLLNSASCRYVQVVLKLCKKDIYLSISFSTVEFNFQSCIFSKFIACIYTQQPMLIFFSFDND